MDKSNSDCSWESYKYYRENSLGANLSKYNYLSSYGTVDHKMTLDLEDDAARAHMGGNWRMPTFDEIQELVECSTDKWITNYNESGVNGRKFTGPNGNSIFFPASGGRLNSSFYDQGDRSNVLSSSVHDSNPVYAWSLYFNSVEALADGDSGCSRFKGFVVRGVFK